MNARPTNTTSVGRFIIEWLRCLVAVGVAALRGRKMDWHSFRRRRGPQGERLGTCTKCGATVKFTGYAKGTAAFHCDACGNEATWQ